MGNLTRNFYPKGWTPNEDEFNGDPTGLVRVDNLQFEEGMICSLARGTRRISSGPFAVAPNRLFSHYFGTIEDGGGNPLGQVKARYVSTNGNVYRNYGTLKTAEDFDMGFLSGGDPAYTAFGSGWGNVFAFSGTQKRKDSGKYQEDLGIPKADGLLAVANEQDFVGIPQAWADWIAVEGTIGNGPDYVQSIPDATSLRGIVQYPDYGLDLLWDSTDFTGTGTDTPNDIFQMQIRLGDVAKVVKVRVEFLLDTPQEPGTAMDVSDYYSMEWLSSEALESQPDFFDPKVYGYESTQEFVDHINEYGYPGVKLESFFREGQDFWGTIQCLRSQFARTGIDQNKTWATIKAIRCIVTVTENGIDAYFTDLKFIGGEQGQLNGWYSYVKVDVRLVDGYLEVGLPSDPVEVYVVNSNTTIYPSAVNGQANECWIYRSSSRVPGYYRVRRIELAGFGFQADPFVDNLSDADSLRENIQLDWFREAIPDGIQYVVGPYYQRMLYFDLGTMYVTNRDDPGAIDSRFKYQVASDESEFILWALEIIDGMVLVGTSKDIYELRGRGDFDPDTQTLDFQVRAYGVGDPPVSLAFTKYRNNLIYLSKSGWRILAGSTEDSMTDVIDLLYRGYTRHEIAPVSIPFNNSNVVWCGVSKNKFIATVDLGASGRMLHIFDFMFKKWEYWWDKTTAADNPLAFHVESDGIVIYSTIAEGDKYLHEWGYGNVINNGDVDEYQQQWLLRTIADSNGQPLQRKDSFTMKIEADTGNEAITIKLYGYKDTYPAETYTWTTFTFNGRQTHYFNLSDAFPSGALFKRYQLEISGQTAAFKFYSWAIEYSERPVQTNFLRVGPFNYGVAGRKRIPEIPITIDTLGSTVTVTPILDGVAKTPSTCIKAYKGTYQHLFTDDQAAHDIELLLYDNTGIFEFYEPIQPREVEVLPDPLKFKFINYTNFGTTKRKRIIQLALIIDTRGSDVTYTPYVDGVAKTPQVINTNRKDTVLYFFTVDTIGIDVGGTLEGANEFEFFEVSWNDSIWEVLPVAAKYIRIPPTNWGIAARKRIRTWPIVIDTGGSDVTFTPYVDGVAQSPTVFNTATKRTVLHYFTTDVFGIDYWAELSGVGEFEYYQSLNPENVETLPVAKKFDQFGPVEFNRIGRVRNIRIRLVPTGTLMTIIVYAQDAVLLTGSFVTVPDKEDTYEVSLPKGVSPTILRVEISSADIFHRFYSEYRVEISGNTTQFRTLKIQ